MLGKVLQNLLQVSFADDFGFLFVLGSDLIKVVYPHSFHLVKSGVVSSVNGVLAVDVSNTQKGIVFA
jgi:hypothetical protein